MSKRLQSRSDLAKVDAHEIMPEEYEEIPELTQEWFARAQLHIGGVPVKRGPTQGGKSETGGQPAA